MGPEEHENHSMPGFSASVNDWFDRMQILLQKQLVPLNLAAVLNRTNAVDYQKFVIRT